MNNSQLVFFIEGNDDERFFKNIIYPFVQEKYSKISYYKYSKKKKEKIKQFVNSIISMKADYIYISDIDDLPCITTKKNKIIDQFNSKITENYIIVVVKEIESWYLAGLDEKALKNLGVHKKFENTNNIIKEHFNYLIPKKMARIEFMQKILEYYNVEVAKRKNESFKYFMKNLEI